MSKRVAPSHKQRIGWWGERNAENYLVDRGLELVARYVRTSYGEIDLVMRTSQEWVFVEVKARTSDSYGMPEKAITKSKRSHLVAAVEAYLVTVDEPPNQWRVDVVAVRGKPGENEVEVIWFENALA